MVFVERDGRIVFVSIIERYNEDVKQRYKIIRGFNSSESADAF